MAKKDKFTAEGDEVQESAISAEDQAANEARATELATLAEEETTIKQRLGEIATRRRELGVTRVVNRGPRGVGDYVKTLITEGKTNEEILALVKENFPTNNTNANCVNWYRNALKQWPDGKRPSAKKAYSSEEVASEEIPSEAA